MKRFISIALFLWLLAACGTASTQQVGLQPTAEMMKQATPTAEMMKQTTPTAEMMKQATPTAEAMIDDQPVLPAWQTLQLGNARTGETFSLADFKGRTVFVETMATWCSKCRQQLLNVREARAGLVGDSYVFVALSVETNGSKEELAVYADDAGFDWVFAVATPELLQELVKEFGRSIINPPSTPHFVIAPDGKATSLSTGIETSEQLVALLKKNGA